MTPAPPKVAHKPLLKAALLLSATALMGCQALAQPPVPSISPAKEEALEDTRAALSDEGLQDAFDAVADSAEGTVETVLDGRLSQGGLITGTTAPGSSITLDGEAIPVDEDGRFLFGFGRDHGQSAVLVVTQPGQDPVERVLPIAPRTWKESRITVTDTNKVTPYKKADLDKIAVDTKKKNDARSARAVLAYWTTGFVWPTDGCVSSPFGYRRIVNGSPRRYHTGVDVAAPDGMSPMDYIGTDVRAPAPGYVRLADPDMFFEGGLVFIDHGQMLETAVMHLSSVDVEAGDYVEQGQKIGEVGMSGRVTGPHLHWSLKWRSRLLDPTLVVDERGVCTD